MPPSAVTRRGETLGVYVPTRRKQPEAANLADLKAAADRLAEALRKRSMKKELVADFSNCAGKASAQPVEMIVLDATSRAHESEQE